MQLGIWRNDLLQGVKNPLRCWLLVLVSTCVGTSVAAEQSTQSSQCDAPEIVARLEMQNAVFELVSPVNEEPIPFRDEAIEILENWLGREPRMDGRQRVDGARMAKAREVFTRCARAGIPGALLLEGAILSASARTDVELKQAKANFERAASGGVSIAHFGAANIDYRLGDIGQAEKELTQLLAKNQRFTPETIGLMLRSGKLFPKNSRAAQPWLVIAATKDNSAPAQRALFEMYSSGEGVTRSESEAARWLTMLKDNPEGQRNWDAEEEIMKNAKRNNQ